MKVEVVQFQERPIARMSDEIRDKLSAAEESIFRVYMAGHPVYYAFSGGKDSATVTDIGLRAAVRAKAAGADPMSVVGTSDTLVENPEIRAHYLSELAKMRAFAGANGLRLKTAVMRPSLASSWQVAVLSGRAIPSFAGASSDCTVDLKTSPQKRYRKGLFQEWMERGHPPPVTILGVRRGESAIRGERMRARGDSAEVPVTNKDGDLVLAPIADWDELDVFEHLGNVTNGFLRSYSDFKETDRIYAHAAGTSCSVAAIDTHSARRSPGCGARHGCWTCQKAEDRSLEAMIAFDPRYEYARGLNKLNKLLRATRYDWSRRHWVGRTIKGGFVQIKPDTYSAAFARDLTRYMLQLDYDEGVRAQRAREPRKFEVLPLEMMIAVDAMQNINGLARPFQIWADYRDIYQRGIRYDIPDVPPVPKTPMPAPRYLYVGNEWDEIGGHSTWTGLRSAYLEALTEDSPCRPQLVELKNGRHVWDLPRDLEFSVDSESAQMLLDFELEHLLERYDQGYPVGGIAEGYKWYTQFGCVTLSAGKLSKHDEVLRRTALKARLGLTLDFNLTELLARTVSFGELPAEARASWAPKAAAVRSDVSTGHVVASATEEPAADEYPDDADDTAPMSPGP